MQTASPPSTPTLQEVQPQVQNLPKPKLESGNKEQYEKETNCSLINGRVNYII